MATPPSHPFTYSTADIVFRSSDDVFYKLHKLVLSLASDFFNDMFELPQPMTELNPSARPTDDQEHDGLPVIPVSEPSSVLTPLFLLCYPLESPDPDLTTITQVRAVLEAAIKYDARKAVKITRGRLRELMPSAPLRVYAIACRLGFEDDARDAAKEVHAQKARDGYVEELEDIPFGAYHRLLYYCAIGGGSAPGQQFTFCHTTTAGTGASGLGVTIDGRQIKKMPRRNPGVIPVSSPPSSSTSPPPASAAESSPATSEPSVNGPSDPQPSESQTCAADDHDVILITCDARQLRSAGDAMLRASLVLRALAESPSASTEGIRVPEPYATMSILVRIYDPLEHVEIFNLLDIHNALVAAEKYQMQKAIALLQASLKSRQAAVPATANGTSGEFLLIYAIACRFGLRDLAQLAARATLRCNLTHILFPAVDEVDISAGYLHRLLDYHRRCRAAITPIFETRTWLQGIWRQRVQNALCHSSKAPDATIPAFFFNGQQVQLQFPALKWACWYEPYMKAAADSAPWPSSVSVTREDVLHAGLGVNLTYPHATAPTSPGVTPSGPCVHCTQGKGAVQLFQFSQHVASTITSLERDVNLSWPAATTSVAAEQAASAASTSST
ncbi:hypothetical protein GSI_12647 [Ganoderma sinense ZZ0214-1]|uniref:BTB domain-containing protein n=1 Tax=Ganoderma sinense ZZ0214-1 TaxID=1077348 RepID=A0A2G8RTC0_9APHY|nr:hypothetical protein GSI_12647 [Ganoderma sinense ZZ0214-1]